MKSGGTITGTIFNIQRFSVQDGPGIRTTVFLKGCPLTCLWCSNPESQSPLPEVAHRDSLCIGCGVCLKVCDRGATRLIAGEGVPRVEIDRRKCVTCGKCIEACSARARKIYGQTMTVEEVFEEIRKDIDFYSNSGGGVTASGGEPLSQADFVTELFRQSHRIGIHTTLETCGYAERSVLEKVLPETDLVLYDLKLLDSHGHRKSTGKSNRQILSNAKVTAERGIPVRFRIPLIPGMNDSAENLDAIARFISELDPVPPVDLLPYHRFGESKYGMLDREYQLSDLRTPEQAQIETAMEVFKRYHLDCAIQE
jgi:pyruvate formate lyase activating enzyme